MPGLIVFDHDVEDDNELAHAGGFGSGSFD
jgi:hypothetical protein